MALYVSIILLSALTAFSETSPPPQSELLWLEAGTTVGLVLAHGFAAWVSARMMGDMDEELDPGRLLLVQLGSAVTVGVIAMVAVLVAPPSVELIAARYTVAFTIAALVFLESRTTNTAWRAAFYGFLALVAGVTVAIIKSNLVH